MPIPKTGSSANGKINTNGARCHYTIPNIKRLLGKVSEHDHLYYQLALKGCPMYTCLCKESLSCIEPQFYMEAPTTKRMFDILTPCPRFISCQSFSQWKSNINLNKLNRIFNGLTLKPEILTFYVLPIGPFPDFIRNYKVHNGLNFFELLKEFLKTFFTGCKIMLMAERNIEEFALKKREHSLTGKEQYLVTDFFPVLKSLLPKTGFCIIGLTWCDLYPCANLNFVLGQASFESHCCVASFGRFDPTNVKGFKGNTSGISVEEMEDIKEVNFSVLWKLFKVTSHEICHVLGLRHCSTFLCLMNESTSSKEALHQPLMLCPLCMKKIHHACSRWPKKKGLFNINTHLAAIFHFLCVVREIEQYSPTNVSKDTKEVSATKQLDLTLTWIQDMLHLT